MKITIQDIGPGEEEEIVVRCREGKHAGRTGKIKMCPDRGAEMR